VKQKKRKSKAITSLNLVNSVLEKTQNRSIRGNGGFGRRKRGMNLRWRRSDLSIVDGFRRMKSNWVGRRGFRC